MEIVSPIWVSPYALERQSLCPTALSAMWHISSVHKGVGCVRCAAEVTLREGAGQLPALLLDQGSLPSGH
jgi:hypothetical protein